MKTDKFIVKTKEFCSAKYIYKRSHRLGKNI
jgi:hypothetical protein